MPGGGGGGNQFSTTTVEQQFAPGQEEFLRNLFDTATTLFNDPNVQFFPGQTVAQPRGASTSAQKDAKQFAKGPLTDSTNASLDALKFGLNDVLFPESNPALRASAEGAIRPAEEALTRRILPQLGTSATGIGQAGSSRQGIAEGLAVSDFTQQALDTTSSIYSDAYNRGLQTLERSLLASPSVQQASLLPFDVRDAVGVARQQQDQRNINSDVERFNFNQFLPFNLLQDQAALGFGAPSAGTTTSSVTPGATQPGGFQSFLGGASTGFAIGNSIPGLQGYGGLIGGALGGLASLFVD